MRVTSFFFSELLTKTFQKQDVFIINAHGNIRLVFIGVCDTLKIYKFARIATYNIIKRLVRHDDAMSESPLAT